MKETTLKKDLHLDSKIVSNIEVEVFYATSNKTVEECLIQILKRKLGEG